MKHLLVYILLVSMPACGGGSGGSTPTAPITPPVAIQPVEPDSPQKLNVLMIAVDDLNTWVGHLKGHPNTLTPNIDKLARRGVSFRQAYSPSPACKPARTAILTGVRPSSSGIYRNEEDETFALQQASTLPDYFAQHGYETLATGKLFHIPHPLPSLFQTYFSGAGSINHDTRLNGVDTLGPSFDWGPINAADESTPDFSRASWAADQLGRNFNKPFFLSVGIVRPHLPWIVPAKYFNKFPLDAIELPLGVMEADLLDIPKGGAMGKSDVHRLIIDAKAWEKAVQAYLASINYADTMIGVILDALEASAYRDNTIVVLWGDHGWQLGEKERWGKDSLWAASSRTTFVISAPGMERAGSIVDSSVDLMSIYPTLIELTGLPIRSAVEGDSITALLQNPAVDWEGIALTSNREEQHAIRYKEWSYIIHANGSDQLYNIADDPYEWHNLAEIESYRDTRELMKRKILGAL